MYKCNDCGLIFRNEYAHSYTEFVGECHGERIYEKYVECPHCNGSIEEIEPCPICGEYEGVKAGEMYCNECKKNIQRKLSDLFRDNFNEAEMQYLNDEFGFEI